jgi:hypothetical protein
VAVEITAFELEVVHFPSMDHRENNHIGAALTSPEQILAFITIALIENRLRIVARNL